METREYQTQAERQINTLLNAKRSHVYLGPCSCGKTFIAANVIKARNEILDRRVYVLVPQVEIFDEWMRVLSANGLNPGYINDEGVRGKDRGVYVCMALSLLNVLPVLPESLYPDEIITDEMQHSLAGSWEQIYNFFPMATRLGLTATLYHGSLRSFEHLYTDVVQTITKSMAIKQGYITKPLLVAPEEWVQDIPMNGDDFNVEAQAEILGEPKIIGNVIDFYSRTFEGKPVIVPCSTYAHAAAMTEAFNDAGWKFEHLHSKLHKTERKRILKAVAAGNINGICTVGIGIEGMSIHGLYGVLWLRRTLSPIIWTQFNGRAERVLEGKKYYICADFVGNSVIHGLPDRDLSWTIQQEAAEIAETEEGRPVMVKCPRPGCGVMNSGLNTHCHFCGCNLEDGSERESRGGSFPVMVDGNLVIVESDGQARELDEHIQSIKVEQQELREEAIKEARKLITDNEKATILRKGLFDGSGRKLFKETLRDWS